MGASPLLQLGLRAMNASSAQMNVIGHNIANANVAGYSRQTAEFSTAPGQFSGAGYFGKGVRLDTVVRAHDAFLTREASATAALAQMDGVRRTLLGQLEAVFRPGELGLGYSAGELLNAMSDLAARPSDPSTRQVVLARAEEFASRLREAGGQFDSLQRGVTEDLRAATAEVNGLAKSVAALNAQIAAVRGLGQPPNDLLDERDRLVARIAEHVQVSTIAADDGTLGVFVAGGQRLVLGADHGTLAVMPDPTDPARSALALTEGATQRPLSEATLGGGCIAGLLRFQNIDLRDARNLAGQYAVAVTGAINAQQALGVNLHAPPGSVPAAALFAVGEPRAIPAAGNARDATGAPIATVALAITDPAAVMASDYALEPDAALPGQYRLTRLSDGLVRTIASGATVDGVRIAIGPPAPAAGESFLLQPVSRAANFTQRLLADPRDLAAASPLVATASSANIGTGAVASLTMTAPPGQPQAVAQVAFTDDAGAYAWTLTDPGTGTVLASGTGTWQPGQPIPQPPVAINGFALQLSGVPRNGDTFAIEPVTADTVASNNGNALAMAALRDGGLVGGATATDAWASAMADIGVRVQGADVAASISTAVAAETERQRSSGAGVDLDEEAARLIQFQQSYQAAAKVLQVAQAMFDTLLQTAAR